MNRIDYLTPVSSFTPEEAVLRPKASLPLPEDLVVKIVHELKNDPEDIKNLMFVSKKMKDIVQGEVARNSELLRLIKAHNNLCRIRNQCRLFNRPNYSAIRTELLANLRQNGFRKLGVGVEVGAISIDDLIFIGNQSSIMTYLSIGMREYLASLPNPRQPDERKLDFYTRQFKYLLEQPRDMANLTNYIRSTHEKDSPIARGGGERIELYFKQSYPELFFRCAAQSVTS